MANFYAKLKEMFEDCDVSYIEPLSYMKLFMSHQHLDAAKSKTILFYKRGEPSEKAQMKPVTVHNNISDLNRLNLTGSPLKDSCNFEPLDESLHEELITKNAWNDDEETFHCIAMAEAQSYFNQILFDFRSENIPKCWALCDSSDKTMLLSIEKQGAKYIRGILKFNGHIEFKSVDLNKLQERHLSYVVKQFGPTEGMVDSYYQLGDSTMLQVSRPINSTMSRIKTTDGKMSSKMILHQSVRINNLQSIAHKFWIQLGILNDIKSSIVAYKQSKNENCLNFDGFSCGDIGAIKQEIYEMLTQPIPIGLTDDDDGIIHETNSNIDKVVESARMRESGELTDQLWGVLKACPSYEVLKEMIEFIFTTSAKINVVNMPSNETRLATLIRDVCDQRIAIPRLIGSEPLELLLEIGLEKVSKDYEYIFTKSRLCSAEDLQGDKRMTVSNGGFDVRKSLKTQFSVNGGPARKTLMHKKSSECMGLNDTNDAVGFQNSQFNLKTVDGDLARLGRIHLILEHLLIIKLNLNMENVYTTFLEDLYKPLISFDVLKDMTTDCQTITVTNAKILSKIESYPQRQHVYLKARNQFKIYHNTFYFSTDPVFPPHVFNCLKNDDLAMDSTTNIYYEHQYLEIEDA